MKRRRFFAIPPRELAEVKRNPLFKARSREIQFRYANIDKTTRGE